MPWTRFEESPPRHLRQSDRNVIEAEPGGHRTSQTGERVFVGHDEDVAAQIEETRQLISPVLRLGGPRTDRRREIARDDTDRQEREERHPILGIRDGPCPNWWEKKEVETQHGHHGHDDTDPDARGRGDQQNNQEKRQ